MFIWLRFTLPQFASYLSSFQTDPNLNSLKGSHFLNLTTLDVSHNHINDISIIRDVNVPKLSTLVAANNDISDISPIAESKLTELSNLDASYNKISNVDAFAKSSFTKLKTLKVDHNQISNINVMRDSRIVIPVYTYTMSLIIILMIFHLWRVMSFHPIQMLLVRNILVQLR
ncbi:leucine-rich repeat domain-containing protein [Levilactobacillus brevis]|uniref:leucine-rich repeat domain-containing protein n=1 Tax=Levilactobacillus brevis TaxID=1580 RepID=UPI0032EB9C21